MDILRSKCKLEIVVVQQAGEMVFVPSTWTHKVENLCETLSINHNWITTASIDYTWECIMTEMAEVDRELGKWNESRHGTQRSLCFEVVLDWM